MFVALNSLIKHGSALGPQKNCICTHVLRVVVFAVSAFLLIGGLYALGARHTNFAEYLLGGWGGVEVLTSGIDYATNDPPKTLTYIDHLIAQINKTPSKNLLHVLLYFLAITPQVQFPEPLSKTDKDFLQQNKKMNFYKIGNTFHYSPAKGPAPTRPPQMLSLILQLQRNEDRSYIFDRDPQSARERLLKELSKFLQS